MSLLALAALAASGVAGAAAEDDEPPAKPPLYSGLMGFPSIKAIGDPEQFVWEVQVAPSQELVQFDERNAYVLYKGGIRAFTITAEQARDANGAEVPTSFAVIAPNYVELTVHHRAGNPAAGGAPFRYPVSAGSPFTAGPSTAIYIDGPKPASPAVGRCIVPKLTGRFLAATRTVLANAGCRLGAVRGRRGKAAKVVKQFRDPGTVLGAGSRVAVRLD